MLNPPFASVVLADEAATAAFAAALAPCLRAGDVVALGGTLGMGKTALARALVRTLVGAEIDVPSPTFTLVQHYEAQRNGASLPIWHADCYRLHHAEEAVEIGLEEALQHALCLIEWPERIAAFLPAATLWLTLEAGSTPTATPTERRAVLASAHASAWEKRLRPLTAFFASVSP